MSGGGEGRASPGGTGRQQGSGPHSDPGCGVPGPPSAHLAHSPTYIPGEGVCGQAQGDEERHAGGQSDGLHWGGEKGRLTGCLLLPTLSSCQHPSTCPWGQ